MGMVLKWEEEVLITYAMMMTLFWKWKLSPNTCKGRKKGLILNIKKTKLITTDTAASLWTVNEDTEVNDIFLNGLSRIKESDVQSYATATD